MKVGDLVMAAWYGCDDMKYGVITDIRAGGCLAFIYWMDGTTSLLDDNYFEVISNDRDNKKT